MPFTLPLMAVAIGRHGHVPTSGKPLTLCCVLSPSSTLLLTHCMHTPKQPLLCHMAHPGPALSTLHPTYNNTFMDQCYHCCAFTHTLYSTSHSTAIHSHLPPPLFSHTLACILSHTARCHHLEDSSPAKVPLCPSAAPTTPH